MDVSEKQFKFLLVGGEAVGKTCIALRLCQEKYDKQYKQTVGVDFFVKRVLLPAPNELTISTPKFSGIIRFDNNHSIIACVNSSSPGGNVSATIQLWDVGSQAITGDMLDKYLYGAHAILFVYDITNMTSFATLGDWIQAVHNVFSEETPHLALISNKGDLEHSRIVKLDRHLKFALDNAMSSHSISAKTGESVALCFQKIAGELLGIRLTRSEQETVQPVVKAEIVPQGPSVPPADCSKNSSVCIVQ